MNFSGSAIAPFSMMKFRFHQGGSNFRSLNWESVCSPILFEVKKVNDVNAPKEPGDNRLEPPRRGRPKVGRDDECLRKVAELYFLERLSVRKVATVLGLSHMTVYRMLNEMDISEVFEIGM